MNNETHQPENVIRYPLRTTCHGHRKVDEVIWEVNDIGQKTHEGRPPVVSTP